MLIQKSHLIIILIFTLAFISRTYNLNNFPHFVPGYPFFGKEILDIKGLYNDEADYFLWAKDILNNPLALTAYQPWLQLFLISASLAIFGLNTFAGRLPSAVFSSLSVVLVYFICLREVQ